REKNNISRRWMYILCCVILLLPISYGIMQLYKPWAQDTASPTITLDANTISMPSEKKYKPPIPELRAAGKKIMVEPPPQSSILEPRPLNETPQRAALPAMTVDPAIPYLEELEPYIRETVPPLHLAGHVYSSDPQLRMILINKSIVREKERIEKDFILEEITPEGVILRSGDIRFRMKAY
ncbi:MAG: general secretion pathway protein GspB, partial [Desulfopila sp.]|nr:general secretion pathway protein GspB [Desulfopila sp.]